MRKIRNKDRFRISIHLQIACLDISRAKSKREWTSNAVSNNIPPRTEELHLSQRRPRRRRVLGRAGITLKSILLS